MKPKTYPRSALRAVHHEYRTRGLSLKRAGRLLRPTLSAGALSRKFREAGLRTAPPGRKPKVSKIERKRK